MRATAAYTPTWNVPLLDWRKIIFLYSAENKNIKVAVTSGDSLVYSG